MEQKFRVLIVDDNSLNSKLLKVLIQKESGFDIVFAESASEALFFYLTQEWDIVFLDIIMPVLSGETFLIAIDQLIKKGHIPFRQNIILCTSLSMELIKKLCGFESVSGFVRKPVEQSSLMDQVHVCLNRKNRDQS
jgi:CheY-like chemotaxis protein